MERGPRRDDRRRREDTRDHRSRYERDRSRSPPPRERRDERRRDRSPPPRSPPRGPAHRSDRDRDRDSHRGRDRQPSGTPPPSRTPAGRPQPRAPLDSRSNNAAPRGRKDVNQEQPPDTRMQNGAEDEDSEAEMQRVLGFKGFRSTKNTKVPGNDKNYGVSKAKTTEYRQYMNRQGGFNRPLSPSRM